MVAEVVVGRPIVALSLFYDFRKIQNSIIDQDETMIQTSSVENLTNLKLP